MKKYIIKLYGNYYGDFPNLKIDENESTKRLSGDRNIVFYEDREDEILMLIPRNKSSLKNKHIEILVVTYKNNIQELIDFVKQIIKDLNDKYKMNCFKISLNNKLKIFVNFYDYIDDNFEIEGTYKKFRSINALEFWFNIIAIIIFIFCFVVEIVAKDYFFAIPYLGTSILIIINILRIKPKSDIELRINGQIEDKAWEIKESEDSQFPI